MGRYYYSSKTEADSLKKIQNWWLNKHGYFRGSWVSGSIGWTNSWSGQNSSVSIVTVLNDHEKYLRIYYTQTEENGEKKEFDYKIPIATTLCYFGGQRYWFTCPWYSNGIYCGRRVGVLYKGGKYFACRHCYNLSYVSRNQTNSNRFAGLDVIFKSEKIAEKKASLRVKFWKGRGTKRYQRLENKERILMNRLARLSKFL